MDLDRTFIAIRERSVLDTLDLSLQVCRLYAWPLILTMSWGAIPLALINHALIGWMLTAGVGLGAPEDEASALIRFTWTMLLLVAIEAPWASLFVTAYLGKAMFLRRPRIREVVREVIPLWPRVAWCHLVGRGVLAALCLMLLVPRDSAYTGPEVLLMLLVAAVMLRRATAPFLNEILVLEKNPLRSTARQPLTAGQRSRLLHRSGAGSLFQLGLVTTIAAMLLTGVLFGAGICLRGILFDNWSLDVGLFLIGVPLSLWLTAAFVAVVRFLAYLDLRIRHEGWEVELRMRAEGSRLAGQWS